MQGEVGTIATYFQTPGLDAATPTSWKPGERFVLNCCLPPSWDPCLSPGLCPEGPEEKVVIPGKEGGIPRLKM